MDGAGGAGKAFAEEEEDEAPLTPTPPGEATSLVIIVPGADVEAAPAADEAPMPDTPCRLECPAGGIGSCVGPTRRIWAGVKLDGAMVV